MAQARQCPTQNRAEKLPKAALSSFKGFIYIMLFLLAGVANAQTPGVIFKQAGAGRAVLDPNRDGYVSSSSNGFTGSDIGTASEIPYRALPQIGLEPTSDLRVGPSFKFTDIVDDGNESGVSMYVDGSNNYMFRFRLGGSAPNSKGYSILFDIDQKFGTTGATADPNAVTGNPGFEFEILLATNFGVRVNNIDGTNVPVQVGPELPYDDYAQKSVALSTNGGDLDVFYDFYVPLSAIQAAFPTFNNNTPFRAVGLTIIAPQSAMQQTTISDIGGVVSNNLGVIASYYALINNFQPTSASGITGSGSFPPDKSVAPVVNGPITTNQTTITGTSVEASGTTIVVYFNGQVAGSTTVQANGTWTFNAGALTTGVNVTATAQASGELISVVSNTVAISGVSCSGAVSKPIASITCSSQKGIQGTVQPGTPSGTVIRLYSITTTGISTTPSSLQVITDGTLTFFAKCNTALQNCNSGTAQDACLIGSYVITAQEPGKCESGYSNTSFCSTNSTTTAPVITSTGLKPSTTSVSGTLTASSTGAVVYLLSNGSVIGSVNLTSSGSNIPWTISPVVLKAGQTITAIAIQSGSCVSSVSNAQTVSAIAPTLFSPIFTNSTFINGGSSEEPGTIITVYRNGVAIGTAIVDNNNSWSLSTAGITLAVNDNITAAVTTQNGTQVSPISAAIVVKGYTTTLPIVNGPLIEGTTSVSGTSGSPNGTIINVYIDGYKIGTTTVNGGTWTLSGLSNSLTAPDLYAGGAVYATAQETNANESANSNSVIVGCPVLSANNAVTINPTAIRSGFTTNVTIANSVSGALYTLRNNADNADLSKSLLGTGADLVITSYPLTSSQTIKVRRQQIGAVVCNQTLTNSVNITVYPDADIAITNTSSTNNYLFGQNLSLTATATNNGPGAASGLQVSYVLPAGLTLISTTPPAGTTVTSSVVSGVTTITWNIANLASSASVNLPITASSSSTGTFTTTASLVTTNGTDPNSANNNASLTVTVSPAADIAVSKSISASPYYIGQPVTFTITAVNNGPNSTASLLVRDLLPTGLTYVSASTANGTYANSTGDWTIGTLANGATATLTIVATPNTTSSITNTANKISQSVADPNTANDNSSVTFTAQPSANLAVTNTVSTGPYYNGQNLTYTIGVSNAGPSTATSVSVTDMLPTGLTLVSSTPSTGSYDAATGVWTVGTLTSGQNATLALVVKPQSATTFTTTATASSAIYDPNTANNTASNTITVGRTAELSVSNTVSSGPYNVGQPVTYTVTLTNNGPNAGTGISITDLLPTGLTFSSANAPAGTTYTSSTGEWSVPTISQGQTLTLTLVAIPNTTGSLSTTASVTASGQFDPTSANNSSTVTINAAASSDVALTQTVTSGPYYFGNTVGYTITATNNGPNPATGLVVNDLLSSGYTNVIATPSTGTYNTSTGNWSIGTLNSGLSATLTLTGTLRTTGSVSNTASISTNNTFDPVSANNTTTTTITASDQADLMVSTVVSGGPYNVGLPVTYSVTLTNNGPNTGTGISVTDALPSGLTYSSSTAPAGTSFNSSTGVWSVPSISQGQALTLQVVAVPNTTGNITNTAAVTAAAQYDPTAANNSSSVSINVSPTSDVAITQVVSAGPYYYGNNVTYSVTATNNGPNSTSGLVVRDLLSSGYILQNTPVTPSVGSYNATTGDWTIGTLSSGQTATLTLTGKLQTTGSVTNTASVITNNTFDPVSSNNSTTSTITVAQEADIAITNSVSSGPYYNGQQVTYIVKATNNGPNASTSIVITDVLPSTLTINSTNIPSGTSFNPSTGVWTIPSLAVGANTALTILASPNQTGSITTSASLTSSGVNDGTTANSTNISNTITVLPASDLSVSLTSAPSTALGYTTNTPVDYFIKVTNNGPDAASNVYADFSMPTGFTFVSATVPNGTTYNSTSGRWTIGSIASGANTILAVRVNPPAIVVTDSYSASATVGSSTSYDPYRNNNTDGANITIGPAVDADVALFMSTSAGPYYIGQTVTYTLRAVNNGPTMATSLVVTDQLPTGISFVSATPSSGTTYNSTNGQWTIGNLANDAEATLTLTGRLPLTTSGTSYTNNATKTQTQVDLMPGNNTASSTITLSASGDVALSKVVNSATISVNAPFSYTLTATNNGPDAVSGLNISDVLPNGFTYQSDTAGSGTYFPGSNGTSLWQVGALGIGQSKSITVRVLPTTPGSYNLLSTVSSQTEFDPTNSNNTVSTPVTVNPSSDLRVSSTVSAAPYYNGQNVTYTISVDNLGPNTATGVALTDVLPAGLSFVSSSATSGTYNSATGVWTVGSVNSGATQTLTLVARPTATGSYTNTASISANNSVDPNAANNSASSTISVGAAADVALSKVVNSANISVNAPFSYTLTATNNGPDAVSGLFINDVLPAGFTFQSATADAGTTYNSGGSLWQVGALGIGQSKSVTVTVVPSTPGSYTLVSAVNTQIEFDPTSSNNTVSTPVTVNPSSDLRVSSTVSAAPYYNGQNVTYTISVDNLGPNTATGVALTDVLPAGLSFVSSSATSGTYNSATGVWTVGSVNSGATQTLTLVARPTATGSYTNTASISANNSVDPNAANNSASSTISVGAAADVGVVLTMSSPSNPAVGYYQGEVVRFTVVVNNYGPNTANGIQIFDNVPTGITYVIGSGSSTQGPFSAATGTWDVGTLASGNSATLTFQATLSTSGTFYNAAVKRAQTEFDPNTANDRSEISFTTNPAADVQITNTVSAGPYYVGEQLVYTVSAYNQGPRPATNLSVTDILPAGLTLISNTLSQGTYTNGVWTIGTVNSGDTKTLMLVVSPTTNGSFTTTAAVTNQAVYDPALANNSATNTISVLPSANLVVSNTVSASPYYIGQPVTYTVSVLNSGPSDATGVVLNDLLPDGLTLVSSTGSNGTTYNSTTGQWLAGAISAGQTKTLTLTAVPTVTSTITTTASIAETQQYDSNTANNSASNTITVGPATDLSITESVTAGPYNINDVVTFTLNLANAGPLNTENIQVNYLLPSGFTVLNSNPSVGTYNASTGVWTISNLSNPGAATLTVQAKITQPGDYTVTATIANQSYFDPVSANNTASVSLFVDAETIYTNNTPVNSDVITNGFVIANATDVNGGVVAASITAGTLPEGLSFNSSTGQITVSNASLVAEQTFSLTIHTTDARGGQSDNMLVISIFNDTEAVYTTTALTNKDAFINGFEVANVTDEDGRIVAASITGGTTLPAFLTLNSNGKITVSNQNSVASGTYTFKVLTTDITGGVTVSTISFTIINDIDAVYTNYTPISEYAIVGTVLASVTDQNGAIVQATITSGILPPGSEIGQNSSIIVTGNLQPGSYPVIIVTTDVTGGTTEHNFTLVINADIEATYMVKGAEHWYEYTNGLVLASPTDADGSITSASLVSTNMIAGAIKVETTTGKVIVLERGKIRPGTYTITVSTNDVLGGNTINVLTITIANDRDGDGVSDFRDIDNNNDGIVDAGVSGGFNPFGDIDQDSILNFADQNYTGGFNSFTDQNADGVNDWFDKDLDGIIDGFDADQDGDGILNAIEANKGTVPAGFNPTSGKYTGTITANGMPLAAQTSSNSGISNLSNPDSDNDGILDIADLDSDNDGITDLFESQTTLGYKTPSQFDADKDGLNDSYDASCGCSANGLVTLPYNFDADNNPDYLDQDTDNDGFGDDSEGFDNNTHPNAIAGISKDDMMYRATKFVSDGGNPSYYDNALDANDNGLPDWLEDDDHDGIRNYLDFNSGYYFDTNKDGLIDLFDPYTFGTPASPPDNDHDGEPDFRDNNTSNPLPVELSAFEAISKTKVVTLNWETAQELNNEYFEVQRSADGHNFTSIGKVAGNGTTELAHTYTLDDEQPLAGLSYYRLKQVDFDGTSSYSKIVAVNRDSKTQLVVYPNPFIDNVQLSMFTANDEMAQVQIVDMKGSVIYTQKAKLIKGNNEIQLSLQQLSAGVYIIGLTTETQPVQFLRIVKE